MTLLFSSLLYLSVYSCVPIKWAGPIKRAGRNFLSNFKNKHALLSEQGGFSVKFQKGGDIIKHAERNFLWLYKGGIIIKF